MVSTSYPNVKTFMIAPTDNLSMIVPWDRTKATNVVELSDHKDQVEAPLVPMSSTHSSMSGGDAQTL